MQKTVQQVREMNTLEKMLWSVIGLVSSRRPAGASYKREGIGKEKEEKEKEKEKAKEIEIPCGSALMLETTGSDDSNKPRRLLRACWRGQDA
jgi:hypothetical protein